MRTGSLLVSLLAVAGLAACAKPPAPKTPADCADCAAKAEPGVADLNTTPAVAATEAEPAAAATRAPAGAATPAQPPPFDGTPPPDVAAPPGDATKTASGLAYKVLRRGSGTQHPTVADTVRVHYTAWKADGNMFDSSVQRGMPASFPLAGVIPGWSEGVQLMVVGDKTRFWIPGPLAYGDVPQGSLPVGLLVFDVELLAIE